MPVKARWCGRHTDQRRQLRFGSQHPATERAGKSHGLRLGLKLHSKLAARHFANMAEVAGLSLIMIEPCPHLAHNSADIAGRANLDNVQTCLPPPALRERRGAN